MTEKTGLKALLSEPLVHFLIIGAFMFGGHSVWQAYISNTERTIVVTPADIERLSVLWESEAGRPPSADDVRAIVSEYVREEALYREALRLGLDRGDTIIRRRLAQKMGFLLDRSDTFELTDAELRAIYEQAPEVYTRPDRISFVHIPFNFTPNGQTREADIQLALEALQSAAPPDAAELGDPFLLSRVHNELTEVEVTRLFGREFARDLFTQPVGAWSNPLRSRLADHIVKVEARYGGGVPPFEDVIEVVRAREIERRQQVANDAEMSRLLEQYTVILSGSSG